MPLVDQQIVIPLTGGLDSKTAEKLVPAGSMLNLRNLTFDKPGELRKRNGYKTLGKTIDGGSNEITQGNALMAYGSELIEFNADKMYSYGASTDSWTEKGNIVSCHVTQASIIRNSYGQTQADSATASTGLQMFAWVDSSGGLRYCVRDSLTGKMLVPSKLVSATGSKPKVLVCGACLVLFFLDTDPAPTLRVAALPMSIPTATLVPTDVTYPYSATALNTSSPNYDAESWPNVDGSWQMYVTFYSNDGHVWLFGYTDADPTTPLCTACTANVTSNAMPLCVFQDTNTTGPLLLVYDLSGTNNIKYLAYLPFSVAVTAILYAVGNLFVSASIPLNPTAIGLTTQAGVPDGYAFFYATLMAGLYTTVRLRVLPNYNLNLSGNLTLQAAPAAKAFAFQGQAYLPIGFSSPLQPSYWVMDEDGRIASKHLYRNGGGIPLGSYGSAMMPETVQVSATKFRLTLLQQDMVTTLPGTTLLTLGTDSEGNPIRVPTTAVYTQTGVVTNDLDFQDSLNSYLHAELASTLHLSGGFLSMYDGTAPCEHGFFIYPELDDTSIEIGSGGHLGLPNGLTNQYWWCATYEWTDAQGNVHVSAPSIPVQATLPIGVTTASALIVIPSLPFTNKQGSPVTIKVYRTQANGTVFFAAINTVVPGVTGSQNCPIINNKLDAVAAFWDGLSDAEILGNQQLYTTGNVLENIEMNACSAMTVFNNRLVALDSTSPLSFWYSKACSPGVPVQFSEFLTYNVDPRGGNITALYALDQLLIIFKTDSIYYLTGDGATPAGNNPTWSAPILITTDCGATNQRSIVIVPGGLIFQSPTKGWHFLDQGAGTVSYIGAPVERYNGDMTTSSQLIPNANRVMFTLDSGVALVYDYHVRQWAVFDPIPAIDSCLFEEQFCFVDADGTVWQETPGKYSDNGTWITSSFTTAWLQFAALAGFQRARQFELVYTPYTPTQLTVELSYDFGAGVLQSNTLLPVQPNSWGSDSVWGGTLPTDSLTWGGPFGIPTQWRVLLNQQKSESLQVTVTDSQAGPTPGQGASFSGLTFTVGAKKGAFKVGASATTD